MTTGPKVPILPENRKPNYPANTKEPIDVIEKKKKPIITGKIITREKSLGRKFAETFIGEDVSSVGSYIMHDVLVPALKSTISDIVTGGIEMLLFGDTRGVNRRRGTGLLGNTSRVSYTNFYSKPEREASTPFIRTRAHMAQDIILENRWEAEEILSHLVDLIIDFGQATVGDVNEAAGIAGNFTDNKYGWTDLKYADVRKIREGYLLNLPKPKLLD